MGYCTHRTPTTPPTRICGFPSQGKSGLSPRHVLGLRPKVSKLASSPGHSWGRFVQAPPAICAPVASSNQAQQAAGHPDSRKPSTSNIAAATAYHAICHARQHRSLTRHHRQVALPAAPRCPPPSTWLCPPPSAPHMRAGTTAGPRAARAAATAAAGTRAASRRRQPPLPGPAPPPPRLGRRAEGRGLPSACRMFVAELASRFCRQAVQHSYRARTVGVDPLNKSNP
jgi:hypothetical protein